MPISRGRSRGRWKNLGRITTLVLLLTAIGLGYRLISQTSYFKVSSVDVRGDSLGLVTPQITSLSLGQNLIFFPTTDITKKVVANLAVASVTFDRSLPSTITATVTWRQPVLTWQSSTGRYLIDSTGLAYANAGNEQLPQASDPTSALALGDKLTAEQVRSIKDILTALSGKFTILTLHVEGGTVTLTLSTGTIVLMTTTGDSVQGSLALQLILSQAKIDGRLPKTIDLRYAKPVVTF